VSQSIKWESGKEIQEQNKVKIKGDKNKCEETIKRKIKYSKENSILYN
jgi:hypothetical protein